MGIRYLLGLCFALFLVPSLGYSATSPGLIETGFQLPKNWGNASPGGVSGARVTVSSAGTITTTQPNAGALNANMRSRLGVSRAGATLFVRRALMAAPAVMVGAGVLNTVLERNGYAFSNGGFVKINTDPADPAFWGVAPIGVTYRYDGIDYDSLYDSLVAVTAYANTTFYCSNGGCILLGYDETPDIAGNQGLECVQTLRNFCRVYPKLLRLSDNSILTNTYSVSVRNPSGQINCAGGTFYSVEHAGCYAFDAGEPIDVGDVAGDISIDDIDSLSDDELADIINTGLAGIPAANDDLWPEDDLIEIDFSPNKMVIELGTITDVVYPSGPDPDPELQPITTVTTSTATVDLLDPWYEDDPRSETATELLARPRTASNSWANARPIYGTVTVPSVETVVSETYAEGLLTSTNTSTNAGQAGAGTVPPTRPGTGAGTGEGTGSGSGSGFELPSFCSWATVICDWLNWTQSDTGLPPEDPDDDIFAGIDINEFDISGLETIDMSFGGGASCPEPIQIDITFLNRTVEIRYDAWCSLAETARLLVLAVAWMSAVSIIIGGIRRS